MLDILVTESKDTPAEYVAASVASVRDAIAMAGYPANMIVVPGVPGHVGQAMLNGLEKSTAQYVTWVDDDDAVLVNAFSVLAPAFAQSPTAICAREIKLYANGRTQQNFRRHHLTAFKSSWVRDQRLGSFRSLPLAMLLKNLPDAIDVMQWVYQRRMRLSSAMQLRRRYSIQEANL